MLFVFTGFWLVLWHSNGYRLTMPAAFVPSMNEVRYGKAMAIPLEEVFDG